MILADTSVWVQYFRRGLPEFSDALYNCRIAIHSVVLGELSTGNLPRRSQTLTALHALPQTKAGTSDECLAFIETHRLFGRGIGWNDVQLLAAARLTGIPLWSLDTRLVEAAQELGVAYSAKP